MCWKIDEDVRFYLLVLCLFARVVLSCSAVLEISSLNVFSIVADVYLVIGGLYPTKASVKTMNISYFI